MPPLEEWLDIVPDSLVNTFINSLKKFTSRRGCPAKILSDNGDIFVADITKKLVSFHKGKGGF